jgi:hypothetical protein
MEERRILVLTSVVTDSRQDVPPVCQTNANMVVTVPDYTYEFGRETSKLNAPLEFADEDKFLLYYHEYLQKKRMSGCRIGAHCFRSAHQLHMHRWW